MKTFYSQQGEDAFIYKNFINKYNSSGIFVELGGIDGVLYSNTKFFEDYLEFTGTLIEPTEQYKKLVINRPKCKNYNLAVNYSEEPVKILGNHATAGLVETMSEHHKKHWHNQSFEYYVNGCPFAKIIEQSQYKYIDLLSIDVEGAELVVLQTFDFKIPVYVIVIELDESNPEKDFKCRKLLQENGFTFKKRLCLNEFWVNDSYARIPELFKEFSQPNLINNHFPFMEPIARSEIEKALM